MKRSQLNWLIWIVSQGLNTKNDEKAKSLAKKIRERVEREGIEEDLLTQS